MRQSSELREILQAAPRARLDSWGSTWGVPVGERIPGLAKALANPERVAPFVAGLGAPARRLLRRLLADGFVADRPATRAAARALTEIPLAIPARSPSGGKGIFVPGEMEGSIRVALRASDASAATTVLPPDAAPPVSHGDAMLREALFLCEYAALHGIPTTHAGGIPKKDAVRFAELLAERLDEAALARRIDLAETLGLIVRGERILRGGPSRGAFHHASPRAQAALFLRWILARAGAEARDLFRLVADSEEWIDRARLVARRSEGDRTNAGRVEEALASLIEAGLVETSPAALRLSAWGHAASGGKQGKASRRITLLPNGQILAPRDLAPDLAARLFVWAQRRRVDAVEEWEVTRESVARALARGLRSEELLSFVREAAGAEPPPSFAASVAEWESGAKRFRTFTGTVLFARDPSDVGWVGERLTRAGLVVEEALPGAFVLEPAADEEIAAALGGERAVRIEPRAEEETGGLEETERRLAALETVPRKGTFRPVFR